MISREWAVELVERQLLAWYMGYNTRQFLETHEIRHALGGNAPFLVDGVDGSLHQVVPWMCEDFLARRCPALCRCRQHRDRTAVGLAGTASAG